MKYKGTGKIALTDYKNIKWEGKTKDGELVVITLGNAINMGNVDLTMQEKNEVVPQITYTATYDNTDNPADSAEEPWTLEVNGTVKHGAQKIMLGAGIFYIGDEKVGLTRGGGQFVVEREFREIAADGDRGPVKDRIEIDSSVARLTMNTLEVLANFKNLYPGIVETE